MYRKKSRGDIMLKLCGNQEASRKNEYLSKTPFFFIVARHMIPPPIMYKCTGSVVHEWKRLIS